MGLVAAAAWTLALAVPGTRADTTSLHPGTDAARDFATGARLDPRAEHRIRTVLSQQATSARRLAATQIANVRTRFPGVQAKEADCRRSLTVSAPPPDTLVESAATPAASAAPTVGTLSAPLLEAPAAPPVSLPIATCERDDGGTVWSAGSMEVGTRRAPGRAEGFGFHSRGLTFGGERQVFGALTVGAGLGLAREQADAAPDGTANAAEAVSGVLYFSYRPSAGLFVDALAGHASLAMRSARPLGERGMLASGRGGSEWFTVLSAGFQADVSGIALAPYTRFEAVRATLHRAVERAGAAEALQFDRQTLPSWKLAMGVEGASRIETALGVLRPRASLEARQEFEATSSAAVSYADVAGGASHAVHAVHAIEGHGVARQSMLFGLGATLSLPDRWSLAAAYSLDHSAQSRFTRVDLLLSRHLP